MISITNFNAGTGANNIIPSTAHLTGTVRTFNGAVRDLIEKRLHETVEGIAQAHGAKAVLHYKRNYEPTINDTTQSAICAEIAKNLFGKDVVETDFSPSMGAEDFGAMLQKKPGCYAIFGQGEPEDQNSPHNYGLHHPKYDFNDKLIPDVIKYFSGITEHILR